MNKPFEDFFIRLDEWKEIIDNLHFEENVKSSVKYKIDQIRSELKKPLADRNCNKILKLSGELKLVIGLGKYVKQSQTILEKICYSEY
jgi:hypothetical protein